MMLNRADMPWLWMPAIYVPLIKKGFINEIPWIFPRFPAIWRLQSETLSFETGIPRTGIIETGIIELRNDWNTESSKGWNLQGAGISQGGNLGGACVAPCSIRTVGLLPYTLPYVRISEMRVCRFATEITPGASQCPA